MAGRVALVSGDDVFDDGRAPAWSPVGRRVGQHIPADRADQIGDRVGPDRRAVGVAVETPAGAPAFPGGSSPAISPRGHPPVCTRRRPREPRLAGASATNDPDLWDVISDRCGWRPPRLPATTVPPADPVHQRHTPGAVLDDHSYVMMCVPHHPAAPRRCPSRGSRAPECSRQTPRHHCRWRIRAPVPVGTTVDGGVFGPHLPCGLACTSSRTVSSASTDAESISPVVTTSSSSCPATTSRADSHDGRALVASHQALLDDLGPGSGFAGVAENGDHSSELLLG
jgi:hypothetical protein